IGMTLALQHPKKVSKLVLVSAAGIETFDEKARISLRNFMTVKSIMEATDPQITTSIALNFDNYDAPKFGWLVEQRKAWKTRSDFRAYAEVNEKSVSGMLDGPVYEQLDALHLPVLVLYGKGDKMIPNRFFNPGLTTADIASRAGTALHNAKVELLEKAGHLLPLEQPEVFNRVLLAWLTQAPSK
ncbi:MAG TPA: alpha/beta hydrolase, partial [Rhodothermales bacterium]|nr:alpha/beta hydrolase [Rhodothermales bacterium]